MTTEVAQLVADYRQERNALELFDANCWLGRPFEPTFTGIDSLDGLKTALRRYGIRRAVLAHTASVSCGAMEGNQALLEAVQGEDAFVAAATLVPEMASPGDWPGYLRSLIDRGVRLIRLFPAAHNFLLSGAYLGGMLEALQELRLPLMIWHTQTTWPAIAAACEKYPALPLIVEGTGRKLFYDNRIYYALLERYPNLYLETHNLTNYLGLDDLVRRFGAQRLLFGSYFPHLDPNSAAMLICQGTMSMNDRHAIAHGNLQRLLAEVDVT